MKLKTIILIGSGAYLAIGAYNAYLAYQADTARAGTAATYAKRVLAWPAFWTGQSWD